jgi:hypothetical protein
MMKKTSLFFLFLSGAVLVGCSTPASSIDSGVSSSFPPSTSTSASTSESSSVDLASLAADPNGNGTLGDGDNAARYPDDPLYDEIVERKRILLGGETYVETFDRERLATKISPYKADEGAEYTLSDDASKAIEGKSLYLHSLGHFAGIYFNGMKFAANGTYQISFDYRILTASNDFFLQFRSLSDSQNSDVYCSFTGASGTSGNVSHLFTLKNYSDYQLMLFPRDLAGDVAIDNLSLTRLNSVPQLLDAAVTSDFSVGSSAEFTYRYFDPEDNPEKETTFRWFTALDKQGTDKTIIDSSARTLSITSAMAGRYLGVELTPIAVGDDAQSIGKRYDVYGEKSIGDVGNFGAPLALKSGESFTEDFEADIGADHNLLFAAGADNVNAYLTTDSSHVLAGTTSLFFSSSGNYGPIYFSGVSYEAKAIYQLSFDYVVLAKGSTLYVQFRSAAQGNSNDVYSAIDLANKTLTTTYHFSANFSLLDCPDYFLMMFPSATGVDALIDNFSLKRVDGTTPTINDVELGVGDTLSENFDDAYSPKLGFDNAQVPNSLVSSEAGKVISNRSLYFESDGSYHCLFINKGLRYSANATYRVSFSYQILSFVDTLYFQFNNNGAHTVFAQFGATSEVGTLHSFTHDFALGDYTAVVMQIFPGGGSGKTAVIIDDIAIQRIS